MKRFISLMVAGVLLASSLGVASAEAAVKSLNQVKGPAMTSARPGPQVHVHNVGTLWNAVTNIGVYGDPNNNYPSGEWPGGAGLNYIWEGRFWFGARVGGVARVSHADYGNYELKPVDGSVFYFGSGPKSIQDGYVQYDDTDAGIGGHTPIGVQMSERALAWSLPDYDDFEVYYMEIKNVSGGTLNNVFVNWVYDNDVGSGPNGASHGNGGAIDDLVDYDGWTPEGQNIWRYDWVDPLDLDGNGITGYDYWGWPIADLKNPYYWGYSDQYAPAAAIPEPDGIYDEFQIYIEPTAGVIRYQTDVPSKGIVAGDPVVTLDGDTLHGYLFSRNASIMFDGDDLATSDNDFGERTASVPTSGVIGTRLLYNPTPPFNTTPEDTFPRPYSHQWWNWESDPGSDVEKYQYMEGTHALSLGMNFLPHPWDYPGGAPVFDYRYLQAIGPINNWAPNESKKFVVVTGVGYGMQGMRENLDNAMIAYYSGDHDVIGDPVLTYQNPSAYGNQLGFTGSSPVKIVDDRHFILPIPPSIPQLNYSAGDQSVNLVWDTSAESAIDNFVGGPDFEGYKIYRSKYTTANWKLIAVFDVIDGPVYLTNTDGDTVNPITVLSTSTVLTYYEDGYAEAIEAGDYQYIMVDLPGTGLSDIAHQYSDGGGDFMDETGTQAIFRDIEVPINGLNYYYTLAAYDPDKGALKSIESARSNYRKTVGGSADPVVPRANSAGTSNLDNVNVVPNPYKGTASFEARYQNRISFINLPDRCKISIFSLTGDLIDEIWKNDGQAGDASWDLISRNNQSVVSGLYLYVVETPGGDKKIGKFLIIR
ncbi:MAG: hypothetical protein V2A56_08725 [bacterium]